MKIYFDHMVNRTLIKKILEYTRVKLNQPSEIELSISSISERDIRNLNNLYRGVNAVTDVLSF
ncbi:MAG: rRNA maturation RNAse YbeY, partial [Clostridia bacterium]